MNVAVKIIRVSKNPRITVTRLTGDIKFCRQVFNSAPHECVGYPVEPGAIMVERGTKSLISQIKHQ